MKAVFLDTGTLGPDDIDLHPLTAQLPDLEFFADTAPALVAERIAGAEVVFVNKVRLTAELLADAPSLKLVCLAATGTDNVDLDAARAAGIAVCNIREYCTTSVVQHVFALLLTLTQHLDANRDHVHNGRWAASGQFCVLDNPIRELHGMTLGIVGHGTLGRAVGAAAAAFGLEVLAARRPYAADDRSAPGVRDGVRRAGFGHVLETADVISLHCPLTDETENLINGHALARMGGHAILINTARGGLVDSTALVEALHAGRIAGAGIDVLRIEPPVGGEPLVDARLPNLVVTPHIAWSGRESRQRAVQRLADIVAAFLDGAPVNRVA